MRTGGREPPLFSMSRRGHMDNTRTALIEMMRDYQHKEIDYFIGEEVLSVEVISDLSKTFLGCVLSLTL